MKKTIHRVMKTPDGITIHLIQEPGRNPRPHNLTGPAMIYPDGRQEYYINGLKLNASQFVSSTKKYVPKPEEEEA
jgi:hypothetical protein